MSEQLIYLQFTDITPNYGVDSNIAVTDVKKTRFLCQHNLVNTPTTLVEGDTMVQYQQYLKTGGSPSVYDNKTLGIGSLFIPFVELTVNAGDEWEKMTVFSKPTDFLPTVGKAPFTLDTSYFGLETSYFTDDIYGLQYEVYIDTSPTTLPNVVIDTQYIVVGDGTAVYNGNTYRSGEVFVAVDNGAVSFTGTANLKQISSSVQKFYTIIWELENQYNNVILDRVETCVCDDETQILLNKIKAEMDAIKFANYTQRVSVNLGLQTMSWIREKLNQLSGVQ